jgi:hypothetical protein
MKSYIKNILPAAALMLTVGMTSCTGDLDVTPIDPNLNTEVDATSLFNKCYANIGMAGNGGANGDCDIDGLDGGTTGYVRQMFNANELTSDEAICGWGDEGISSFDYDNYDASHPMLRGYYYRLYFGITICNQYLTEFGDHDAKMSAEVRFLRALDYFLLMDGWGNVPFTTEVSSKAPVQYTRKQIYDFVESELLDIEGTLSDATPKTSTQEGYGRVDKAADWILLSRLYLNAQVYTGTAQWDKAKTYAKKVMDSAYQLYTTKKNGWSAYQQLFMGDNGENGASVEAIFPILQDGLKTTSWGTTLFLMAGSTDENVHIKDANTSGNGTTEKWGGNRCRPNLIQKFFPNNDAPTVGAYAMPEAASDNRALFDAVGKGGAARKLNNEDVSAFTDGYACCKFCNFKTDGSAGHSSQFPDADFFFFRAAEAYLTYAEADARLNNGTTTTEGTNAINKIRSRAQATTRTTSYTLNEILDEWSREFYFEGRRRMDLIRFGKFGGNSDYTWQWKGGTYAGRNFSANKNLFAIPTTDLTVNRNLVQNPGY